MLIDLHTHSTASDGTDSPAQLMAAASARGLDVIAITDHDTTGGWERATEALSPGLTLVTGTEFSCAYYDPQGGRTSMHLLGYLFDPEHEGLRAERIRLRENRLGRGHIMVDNLIADGVPITWERVVELADGGAVGRPHIGRALVEAGIVSDVNAAFASLLSSSSKYYVRQQSADVLGMIPLLRAAGGVPVFAHPLARLRGKVVDDDAIVAMVEAGLLGLEVNHPDHVDVDRTHLAGLAGDLGLVATGSSDYHGTNKSTPLGECTTAEAEYERLLSLAVARKPITA